MDAFRQTPPSAPQGGATRHHNKKPGAVSRPGMLSEFRFPEYDESGLPVNRFLGRFAR
jgi:hypothetical protein